MSEIVVKVLQITNYIVILYTSAFFFLERKENVKFRNLKLIILYCIMLLFSFRYFKIGIFVCSQIVVSYVLINSFFQGKVVEKAILVITEMTSIANISLMLQSLVETLFLIRRIDIDYEIVNVIIGSFILVVLLILKKCTHIWRAKKVGVKYTLYFMLLVFTECFMVTSMGELIYRELEMGRKLAFQIAYILMVIFMFIQIGLMIALIISRNVYREKEYLAAKYLEEQKMHYEYLENRERQTKKFRHDIKNHLVIVNDLMSKQRYEECESYLREVGQRVDRFSYKISVNNDFADAIVNKFYLEAQQKGIELQVKGHLPRPCHLSAFDLCTIFSNLLSNAIEAEEASGGKFVYVQLRYTDMEIMVAVENDFKQKLEQENGAFFTTKDDKVNHGFGLENVKECVRKNHGHITINTQNNIFKVLVCVENREGADENCNRRR